MTEIKRSDWVRCKTSPDGPDGLVRRVARNGTWADVAWREGGQQWVKRMPTSALVVVTTIRRVIDGQEWEITDVTREREMGAEVAVR